ncbi:hypothetical protein ACV07N_04050 [Roseivirga echinicomitans]
MMLIVGYEMEKDYVFGKIDGDLTKEIASNYFSKVSKVAKEYGCNKLFTDLREAVLVASRKEMEIMAVDLKDFELDFCMKRAVLISVNVKDYKSWENFNFRNGFKDIRLFSDELAAIEWLQAVD